MTTEDVPMTISTPSASAKGYCIVMNSMVVIGVRWILGRVLKMEELRAKVKDDLLKVDLIFRQAVDEHRKLDEEAARLDNQVFLIPEEESRLREIKKRKLLLKDKIERQIQQVMEGSA